MIMRALALVAALQQPQPAPQMVARVVVTPTNPTVVAGDTMRLGGQALDAQGQPVRGARVMFALRNAESFEAKIDTGGLFTAGAVATIPVAAVAMVPGVKPVTQRFEVRIVPGPAARI